MTYGITKSRSQGLSYRSLSVENRRIRGKKNSLDRSTMELANILSKYLESPNAVGWHRGKRTANPWRTMANTTAGGPQMLGDYGVYSPAGYWSHCAPAIWSGRHSSNCSRCSRFPSRWVRRRVKRVHSHLYDGSCVIYECNGSLYLF